MKRYYECHVTFLLPPIVPPIGGWTNHFTFPGWKFSSIDGDPVLGSGVKSYLTRQMKESQGLDFAIASVESVAANLREQGFQVLRTKVEHVVYDSKQIPDSLLT